MIKASIRMKSFYKDTTFSECCILRNSQLCNNSNSKLTTKLNVTIFITILIENEKC